MTNYSPQYYSRFILSLMNRYSQDELRMILAANQELVDIGLLRTIEGMGISLIFSQPRDENTLAWLRGLSSDVREMLNLNRRLDLLSLQQEVLQAYYQFLGEVLLATLVSVGDVKAIHPLLAQNTDKLNEVLVEILHIWGTMRLNNPEANRPEIAQSIALFSNIMAKFPLSNKASNIEIAIAGYEIILDFYTRDIFPKQWAFTQYNLGIAYRDRILGEKIDNIEKAITACTAALTVYTWEAFPQEWANTKNVLALAYCDRIIGDRAKNLEESIVLCQEVLTILNSEVYHVDWAKTQNNLGIAYQSRIFGDKADNIEQSIIAYTNALTVYTRDTFPQEWAITQYNLANAYCDRIVADKANNIELAIAAYEAALTVYTYEAFPQGWARIQNSLGNAYVNRIIEDKSSNIELAIAALQSALTIRTKEAYPSNWALTKFNLGNAYSQRILGEKTENIELAIACYREALEIHTREAFPTNHISLLYNLGFAYKNTQRLQEAYTIFKDAIDILDEVRGEIVSGEESKRKQAEEWNKLYINMVKVCLELDKLAEAIEYVERSKTRSLIEQILESESQSIFPPEVVTQLKIYRNEIATKQDQIQNSKAENPTVLSQHLQSLRQQRNQLQNTYICVGSQFTFGSLQSILEENTVLIEWYILDDKFLALIVQHTGSITVWQSQLEDLEAFVKWANEYWQNYKEQKDTWKKVLGEELKKLAFILNLDELLKQIPTHCDKLILIPHTLLHLFPIHALPATRNDQNHTCLLDLFVRGVVYAPSCQLLQQVQQRERPNFQSLFAIQNPTEDLYYTDLEVQVIQGYFHSFNVLNKNAATLTAIKNTDLNTYHCTHFSCHGYFNLINPKKSALILANSSIIDTSNKTESERYLDVRLGEEYDLEKCLTLDEIFTLKLEQCRLVTLSACETGLIDPSNNSDEYISLPSGFLLAGSPSVVSSLWGVNDLSTSFLMIKFYENLFKLDNLKTGDVAIALNQAQTWLRNLTIEELDKFLEQHQAQIEKVLAQLRAGQRIFFQEYLKRIKQHQPLPFANPYYWAGFVASGR